PRLRGVADERQIERPARAVGHAPRRQIEEVAVHVRGTAMDDVQPPFEAADGVGDSKRHLVRARRGHVAAYPRAQARNVRRRPRRALVAAVGEEPVPQDRQRLVRRQIWTGPGIDVRPLIEPAEARLTSAGGTSVHQGRADAGYVAREPDVRGPAAVAGEIPCDSQPRTPLRVPYDRGAALILRAIEVEPCP